jgi:hypothetical protein
LQHEQIWHHFESHVLTSGWQYIGAVNSFSPSLRAEFRSGQPRACVALRQPDTRLADPIHGFHCHQLHPPGLFHPARARNPAHAKPWPRLRGTVHLPPPDRAFALSGRSRTRDGNALGFLLCGGPVLHTRRKELPSLVRTSSSRGNEDVQGLGGKERLLSFSRANGRGWSSRV